MASTCGSTTVGEADTVWGSGPAEGAARDDRRAHAPHPDQEHPLDRGGVRDDEPPLGICDDERGLVGGGNRLAREREEPVAFVRSEARTVHERE